MSNRDLLQQSARIFDSLEKWNALFEIHGQSNEIIKTWLTIGAEALRRDFEGSPAPWTCVRWEEPWESKWFISEPGADLIALGIGWWNWEFHLFFDTSSSLDEGTVKGLLALPEFQPLVAQFDPEQLPNKTGRIRSLACDLGFNPFGGSSEPIVRLRELAWYAAHETDRFVKGMSDHVRRITDNSTLTALVRELNLRAKSVSNGKASP